MPSPSNPTTISYNLASVSFATTKTFQLKVPRRHNTGNIVEIMVAVTVLFTAVTTPAHVQVGIAGTLAKYADVTMTTNAADTSWGTRDVATSWLVSDISLSRDGLTSYITLTCLAPTGGTPAGTGHVMVVINWW